MKRPKLVILVLVTVAFVLLAGSVIGAFANNTYIRGLATATMTAQKTAAANAIAIRHAVATAQVQVRATATAVALIPTPTQPPPAQSSYPPVTLNTAWDLYHALVAYGLANSDGNTLPNSWWDCCVAYHPGDYSIEFSDAFSSNTMVVALFNTSSAASPDAYQESENGWSFYQKGRCLLIAVNWPASIYSYESMINMYC